jgi:hypothetical protein
MRTFLIGTFVGTILTSIPTFAMKSDEERDNSYNTPVKRELTPEEKLRNYTDSCDRDPTIDLRNFNRNSYDIPSTRPGKEMAFLSKERALGIMQEPDRPRKINGQWWSISKEEQYTHHKPTSILYATFYPNPSKLYFSNLLTREEVNYHLVESGASPAIQRIFVLEKVKEMTDGRPL